MKRRMVGMVVIALAAFAAAVVSGPTVRGSGHPPRPLALGTASAGGPGSRRVQAPDGRPGRLPAKYRPAPSIKPAAMTLSGTLPGPHPGGSATYDPCPSDDGVIAGEGPSLASPVTIPSLASQPLPGAAAMFNPGPGEVPASYAGTILRPADTGRYPGSRPAVVLLHGIGGDQCQMWWLAQYLAGSGYVTLTLTSPTPPEHDASYGVAIDAARSAVRFLSTPLENPYAFATDAIDLGIAGWSEGSIAASVSQGLPGMGAVKAIVALDDLRGSFLGDTGAPLTFCAPPVEATVTPRVPALGFASDTACDVEPADTRPNIKLSGFSRWHQAGIPAAELPLAGYSHFDYDNRGPKLVPVGFLTLAWFNSWLGGQAGNLGVFTACQLNNQASPASLSSAFNAGMYLPSLGIDSTTWAGDLAKRCGLGPAVVGSVPIP